MHRECPGIVKGALQGHGKMSPLEILLVASGTQEADGC
jgi:hypothetical protein